MNYHQISEDISTMEHQLQEAMEQHNQAVVPFAKQLRAYLDELITAVESQEKPDGPQNPSPRTQ